MMNVTFLFLLLLFLLCPLSSQAGPASEAVEGTANVVGGVGEAVVDTASAVGGSIKGLGDTLTGGTPPSKAREKIDETAEEALKRLMASSKSAKKLFGESYGYAVFDARKFSFLFTTGGGAGVAVQKTSGTRTYMRMFSGGANFGGGVQYYQLIFLFEDKESFDSFVTYGWEASGDASAVIGSDSVDASAKFSHGKAIYHLGKTGIMLGASVSGTKYWKSDSLN